MSTTLSRPPLNDWWDKPVGEFVPVSRRRFVLRVTKALDHRTPVQPDPRRCRRFASLTLVPHYTDIEQLVGWELKFERQVRRVVFGSCLYVPAPARRAPRRRRVRQTYHLDGLVMAVYTDGSVLFYYRGRFKEPRFKRSALYCCAGG